MKQCMLCNCPAIDDASTCPNDGEASWGPCDVSAPASSAPADDDAPKRSVRADRGKAK